MKTNKIFFLFSCFLLCHFSYAQTHHKKKQTIVFICEHGAARSTIAAAYFNKLANEQHLNYQAVFRGLVPDSTVSADTKNGLSKDGFETKNLITKALTKEDVETSSQIVTLNCNLESESSIAKPMQKWVEIPAIKGNYDVARDAIYAKVEAYIAELKKAKKIYPALK